MCIYKGTSGSIVGKDQLRGNCINLAKTGGTPKAKQASGDGEGGIKLIPAFKLLTLPTRMGIKKMAAEGKGEMEHDVFKYHNHSSVLKKHGSCF